MLFSFKAMRTSHKAALPSYGEPIVFLALLEVHYTGIARVASRELQGLPT